MSLQMVNDDNFDAEVLGGSLPVFVKFGAPWCAPCKAVAPIIEGMVEDYESEVKFVEVNIDQTPKLVERFAIRGVPLMMIFSNGKEPVRFNDLATRTNIANFIDNSVEGTGA